MGIEYSLIRSKRKTIAIYIKDKSVIVKAPLKTNIETIESFIENKQNWINNKLNDNAAKIKKFSDVLSIHAFLYMGERVKVSSHNKKTIEVTDSQVLIPNEFISNKTLSVTNKFILGLKRAYKKAAKLHLQKRLDELANFMTLKYNNISLTDAKRKWGSCDSQNSIKLNWRLIMLDNSLIDYVIIHELSHIVHHNHSKSFWTYLSHYFPYYKEAIKCLKDANVLIEYLP